MPRLSRGSPDSGSRHVIVHSITASSPSFEAVLARPFAIEVVDRPARVAGDRPAPSVRPEPRVVMDGVVGEVGGDQLDVAGVEGVVVAADTVERADLGIVYDPLVDSRRSRSSLG